MQDQVNNLMSYFFIFDIAYSLGILIIFVLTTYYFLKKKEPHAQIFASLLGGLILSTVVLVAVYPSGIPYAFYISILALILLAKIVISEFNKNSDSVKENKE